MSFDLGESERAPLSLTDISQMGKCWFVFEPEIGKPVYGELLRKPMKGVAYGHYAFISTAGGVLLIDASAKTGHAMLERLLRKCEIGDDISITYQGKMSPTGLEYHHYEVVAS